MTASAPAGTSSLAFTHRWVPASSATGNTLLLLHGTGADEADLLPLGRALDPSAGLLSPRGKVLENGMPRFFRRVAEGVFDEEDLIARTHELAGFVQRAAAAYGFDPARLVAVGFSNGANIGGGLLLLEPGLIRRAILLRPMVPLVPDPLPDLTGTSVLLGAGRRDPLVTPEETDRLTDLLARAGADVTVTRVGAGHVLSEADVAAARQWLERTPS